MIILYLSASSKTTYSTQDNFKSISIITCKNRPGVAMILKIQIHYHDYSEIYIVLIYHKLLWMDDIIIWFWSVYTKILSNIELTHSYSIIVNIRELNTYISGFSCRAKNWPSNLDGKKMYIYTVKQILIRIYILFLSVNTVSLWHQRSKR